MNRSLPAILLLLGLVYPVSAWGQGLVVDHSSLGQFDQIPENYLGAARNQRVLFMDRSVGVNTHVALDCFTATDYGHSPAYCRQDYQWVNGSWQLTLRNNDDLAAGRVPPYIQFNPSPTLYDRSNWDFYLFYGTWNDMATNFIQGLHNGAIPVRNYVTNATLTVNPLDFTVISFQFSYLNVDEGSTITNFFTHLPGEFDDVYDLEREVSEHLTPHGIPFVYWTTSLSRSIGTDAATQFNEQMREWCRANNKILFDFADIEAHDMNGNSCYDNRDGVAYTTPSGSQSENHPDDGRQLLATCQEKTTETEGGHLGTAQGMISVAKGFWITMARLAGWSGGTSNNLTLASIIPNSGPTAGNTAVRVTGQGFDAGVVIRLGGVALSQQVFVSSTEVQGVTGPHASGTVNVTAEQAGSTGLLTTGYTYTSPPVVNPVISSVIPNSGPTVGNTAVRVLGQNFATGIVIRLGGIALGQQVYVSSTEVRGVTGPHTAGAVDVTADQPGGTAVLTDGYTYTAPVQPNLAPYTPTGWSGPLVVSKSAGTHADDSFLATRDLLYIDWAVINNGPVGLGGSVHVSLFLDGQLQHEWSIASIASGESAVTSDATLGPLVSGQHVLRLEVDSANEVTESNEVDNVLEKSVSVSYPENLGADFNLDGKTDILWRNTANGRNLVWLMNGTSYVQAVQLNTVTNQDWKIVGTGDFNQDGKPDILWRNTNDGRNQVWLMNGTSYLQGMQLNPVTSQDWKIVGTRDFNQDGKVDLLWRNSADGRNQVWLMNGTSYLQGTQLNTVTSQDWKIVGTGDFNQDGKPDILWRNTADGRNLVWLMNGTTYLQGVQLNPVTNQDWKIVGTGDFNQDGKVDLLWRNTNDGHNLVWLMNGTSLLQEVNLNTVSNPNWEIVSY